MTTELDTTENERTYAVGFSGTVRVTVDVSMYDENATDEDYEYAARESAEDAISGLIDHNAADCDVTDADLVSVSEARPADVADAVGPREGAAGATKTWDELSPDGAVRFYEGDDPDGFAAEIKATFGFDVTEGAEAHGVGDDGGEWGYRWKWDEAHGYSFLIPAGLVEAVYGSRRWPLGS